MRRLSRTTSAQHAGQNQKDVEIADAGVISLATGQRA